MTEFDAKDIERLIGEHSGFLGKPKAWTREYTSIQRMAWRMLQREKHSFFTFRRYVDGVSHLVKYLKVENPDQALEEIKKAKGIRARTAIFDSFINQLGKEGFKPINIKAIFWACNKFAVSNQIEVNWDFIAKPKAVTKIRDRIPTRAEISTILSFGNIRDKALFLTMMSSGLRVGTAISLKLKEYEHYEDFVLRESARANIEVKPEQIEPYKDLAIIQVSGAEGRKLSEGLWYWTFISPEARRMVDTYLESRKRNGETLTPESALFMAIEKDMQFKYAVNVSRLWRRLLGKAGLDNKIEGTEWFDLHLHTLRKFFHTKCKGSGIETRYYDFWLGHTGEEDLGDSYWREEIPEHAKQYKKAIGELTIFEASGLSSDIEKLKEEKQSTNSILNQQQQHINELEEQLATVRQSLSDFVRNPRKYTQHVERIALDRDQSNEEDCQKVIDQTELETYLKQQWHYVATLPNGKLVVSNE